MGGGTMGGAAKYVKTYELAFFITLKIVKIIRDSNYIPY
jgi:hypothetical protein